MDMGTATMSMGSTATSTGSAASATTSMAMSMGGGSNCKISMLWNWYTVDSCFIARSWHITSRGMFAGSCIGVILLVMSLELLRRGSKEYDRYIVLQAQRRHQRRQSSVSHLPESPSDDASGKSGALATVVSGAPNSLTFRPNLFQQLVRALFHMTQFAVAYFIMLLAMYYNGYIIISIIIGAFLGSFVFSWESISLGSYDKGDTTYCCG